MSKEGRPSQRQLIKSFLSGAAALAILIPISASTLTGCEEPRRSRTVASPMYARPAVSVATPAVSVARPAVENDACQWSRDGKCDDSRYLANATTACAHYTDVTDCRGLRLRDLDALLVNTCQWAFDSECDHPQIGTGLCDVGTDTADCGGQ